MMEASICAGQHYALPSGVMVSVAGTYKDTLRTVAGCDSLITAVSLTVMSPLKNTVTASFCPGATYTLPSGAVVGKPGVYADTIRYIGGCDSLVTTVNLNQMPMPVFGIRPSDPIVCAGDSILLTAYGGDAYQWLPGDGLRSPAAAATYVVPQATATYEVVISSFACNITDTQDVRIIVSPLPVVSVTKTNDVDCQISSTRLNATGGQTYVWTPAATLSDPNSSSPIATPRSTTVYHVQVYSSQGCMSVDSIEVVASGGDVSKGYPVPNAFTPNHDGHNDCFGIKPSSWGDVTNFRLMVFNRQGQVLFATTDPNQCWDGTWKGVAQPADTYVYEVSAMSICGHVYRKGTLILVR
jgi:gliding motility-associated-like protein